MMAEYSSAIRRREKWPARAFCSMHTIDGAVTLGAAIVLVNLLITNGAEAQKLTEDFYNVTCPRVEMIVRNAVASRFQVDRNIAAHLLRLQFHDCAATGCDASLLINGTQSEQSAIPNLTLKGFDVIEDIKAQLEANCTGIVSCSDILALAARDSVALTGGPNFSVPLGRFDANVSAGGSVNLPPPWVTVPESIEFFKTMGLTIQDLVVLLGAHTIGAAHCSTFQDRLFNHNNTGVPDPSMNATFLPLLQKKCPQSSTDVSNVTVPLDYNSEYNFDNNFYGEMMHHHGVMKLDQEIFTHNLTKLLVTEMAVNKTLFSSRFAVSMVKMGQYGVLNATTGHVRKHCYA